MVTTTDMKLAYECEDDAANTTVTDSFASNDGTSSSNTSNLNTTGKNNDGFEMAGTYEIDSGVAQGGGAFSISLWFTWDGVDSYNTLMGNGNSGSSAAFFVLMRNSNDKVELIVYDGGSGQIESTYSESITVGDNAFHHLVLTYDGSTTWGMYVDGTAVTLADSTGSYGGSASNVKFGRSATYPILDGKIDEIYWYDRVLSSGDVSDLYNSGSGKFFPFSVSITVTPSTLTLTTSQPNDDIAILASPLNLGSELSVAVPTVVRESSQKSKVGTGNLSSRFLRTEWPIEQGLIAGTTRQTGRIMNLVPEQGSSIPKRNKAGI